MQRPIASVSQPNKLASRIEKALARKKYDQALAQSEELVAVAPEDGGFRALLGRAYLACGRYRSARVAFQDAVALGNRDVRTIISLALVNIGLGDARTARDLLANHLNDVPAADYGLAMAMAGDAEEGVRVLVGAARERDATVQTRQNLAYALAIAGAWGQARLIAGQDLTAREAEQRIGEWSRGGTGQERVIAMLGVAPRGDDTGMPDRLALHRGGNERQAFAPVAAPVRSEVDLSAPDRTAYVGDDVAPKIEMVADPMADAGLPTASPRRATMAAAALPGGTVHLQSAHISSEMRDGPQASFHEEGKVNLPRRGAPSRQRTESPVTVVSGGGEADDWVVQLGAFDSAAVAREKWRQIKSRHPRLGEFGELFSQVTVKGRIFHRLAIRGFENRHIAQATCRSLNAVGQACFVRLDDNAGRRLASESTQNPML